MLSMKFRIIDCWLWKLGARSHLCKGLLCKLQNEKRQYCHELLRCSRLPKDSCLRQRAHIKEREKSMQAISALERNVPSTLAASSEKEEETASCTIEV